MTMTRHRVDLLSLAFGLLFAAIGAVLLVGDLDLITLDWVAPTVAIAIGVALILAARSQGGPATEAGPPAG
jgi:hypothetical protein